MGIRIGKDYNISYLILISGISERHVPEKIIDNDEVENESFFSTIDNVQNYFNDVLIPKAYNSIVLGA